MALNSNDFQVAPEIIQKAAKCIIGRDYPLPMIDHSLASRINIERLKQVYQSLSKFRNSGSMYTQSDREQGMDLHPSSGEIIALQEPNLNFTTLDDSMVNTAAASMDLQCDTSGKSLHELLESAINETFGTVGMPQ